MDNYVFFCSHYTFKYPYDEWRAVLSNWYPSAFIVEGRIFINSEQYMMWSKAMLFGDDTTAQEILFEVNPDKMKSLGRKVKGFDEDVWEKNREKIMIDALLFKFGQNEELKSILLKTDDKILVEAASYDKIWGIGLGEDEAKNTNPTNWPGLNLLGKCLMRVRSTLRH